jgi:hypothetical protein
MQGFVDLRSGAAPLHVLANRCPGHVLHGAILDFGLGAQRLLAEQLPWRSTVLPCPQDQRDELAFRVLHECVNGRHHRAWPPAPTDPADTAGLQLMLDQQSAQGEYQIADEPARRLYVVAGPLAVLIRQAVSLLQVGVEVFPQQVESVGAGE